MSTDRKNLYSKLFGFAGIWVIFSACVSGMAGPVRENYQVYEPVITRHTVYDNGTPPKNFLYTHCASLEWFDGKFYAIWNANNRTWDEGEWGQELALATSTDFVNWTHPINFIGPGYAKNPVDDPNRKQWQPNLMNYKDQELWCMWLNGGTEDPLRIGGTYLSRLKKGETLWENKKLNRLVELYDEMPGVWSGQNPVMLDSGRVVAPMIYQGGTVLPPVWKPQKPKWVGVLYTDDGGETWNASNVVNIPHTVGGAWEPTVHDQADGTLRMFFRNITTFRTPGPTERLMTCIGTGSKIGEPVEFDPDGQYSFVETAHCRHGIIKLKSGRYCFIHHDLYSPSKAFSARRNGAIYFSRTGGDDFVASRAFIPTEEGICAYPQGIEHDGKLYMIYTFREKDDPVPKTGSGGIEGAVIDPVPSADHFYIWPRDKDYLLMSGDTRTNPDYTYTRPYTSTADNRNVVTFENRGTAGVEIDGVDIADGQALRVRFNVKITSTESQGNTVLCSFGDRLPIRIGIPQGFDGSLCAQSRNGWETIGSFALNQWHTLELVFGRNVFTAAINQQPVKAFQNPEWTPNSRLYLGDGYEVDSILSNQDSVYYIDVDSFETQVIEPNEVACINTQANGPVVRDANGHILVLDNPGTNWTDPATSQLINAADIYLAFEGPDQGAGSPAWQNSGSTAYGESTSRVGTGPAPVTSQSGIKGRCYDGTMLTPMSSVNGTYMYGEFGFDTPMEQALIDVWSFTVTGWIRIDPAAVYTQGRIFASSPIELNYIMQDQGLPTENARFAARIEDSVYTNSTPSSNYIARGKWLFFSVTYDGTKSNNQLSYYFADANIPVALDMQVDMPKGKLEYTGYGGNLWLANTTNVNGERPFVGLLDELRFWTRQDQSGQGALSLEEIERIRLYDLGQSSFSTGTWDGQKTVVQPASGSGPVELFQNRRSESYPVPCPDMLQGQALEVTFDAKVTTAQLFGHTVLCTLGSQQAPIRLVIPGDRPGRLYAYTEFGYEDVGEFTLGTWHEVKLTVSRNTLGVEVDSQTPRTFMTPLVEPGCSFYFGDGWEIDYILSNEESIFEIDYGSVETALINALDVSPVCADTAGPIVQDQTGNIYLLENSGSEPDLGLGASGIPYCVYYGTGGYPFNPQRHIIADAEVYLPFEGGDSGIRSNPWKNKGQAAYNESPIVVGTEQAQTVSTASGGLKGNAYDASFLTEYRTANTYRWGQYNREETYLEEGIKNASSMTITMWIKTDAYLADSHLLWTPAFSLRHYGNWGNSYLRMTIEDSGYQTSGNHYGSIGAWKFLAITYDGTRSTDNLCFYYGSPGTGVAFDRCMSVDKGILEEDYNTGAPLFLGNSNIAGNRPFVGLIDELRIWVNKTDDSGELNLTELEQVRQWDVAGCSLILAGDTNLDCYVNTFDLPNFSHDWLTAAVESDFDGDQSVDLNDAAGMAENWLECAHPHIPGCIGF